MSYLPQMVIGFTIGFGVHHIVTNYGKARRWTWGRQMGITLAICIPTSFAVGLVIRWMQ